MAKNYRNLTANIKRRINPENLAYKPLFESELSTISYSDVLTYVRHAMKGVEPEYTAKTKEAGERVKKHLENLHSLRFQYQGSVMTDTHIKSYSDIDLLTICDKFYLYDSSTIKNILNDSARMNQFSQPIIQKLITENNISSYQGNALDDLKSLRLDSETILTAKYNSCDISGAKAIKIKNTDLNRDVDIVIANWYDDVISIINDKGDFRGIQVYDKHYNRKGDPDYPFLSIKRINEKSADTNGRLKRMIRFLKNVKADSEKNIEVSSFDINAICYSINVASYKEASFRDLVGILFLRLQDLCKNRNSADALKSVDGREYIYRYKQDKIESLNKLLDEVTSIFNDINGKNVYD